ncbi:MAG: ribonuclease E/G, partial [Magnetovibrio sp.]|nr:ribonuclease E/G [Magnetovibrio sp.]
MATKRMLIDSTHSEETRVLVVNGNRLEDFDVEVQSRKRLKGNIYLAKVTRVEPSLQAAFVDYGGNRHGFLAFSEIHPDYYQIPVADREALIAEERAAAAKSSEIEESGEEEESPIETLGGDDSEEFEARRPEISQRKNYKIQEVIKRRQILLIQVVKEERGTKGAALSTYLSLAGRYCVLMPNTDRGGGISRKIGSISDRKKLRKIINDLGILEGMAVIVRTAGSQRSRAEIRRDYDYLLRLWNQIRELTLNSIAPSLVHEEGDLIKRSIRDLYTKDIDEVIVHGEEGYRSAKDFMKILIPSHAKKVQKYKKTESPLTLNYGIDDQLEAIHSNEVRLKSGGYIIINPTEALVAIDVNSGRATKERNIEETALKTNIEAATEIARQLKLRDLAGLIV